MGSNGADDEENAGYDDNQTPLMNKLLDKISYAFMPPDYNRESFIHEMRSKNSNTGGFMDNCKALLTDNTVSHFFVQQRNNNVYGLSKELKEVPKKVVIFMNVPPGKLTEENIPNLVFQEVGGNALQFLYNLSNEVFMPILQNPSYQAGWSDLISKDLMEKLNNFNATMYLTLGQLSGKTLLPLPQKKIIESTTINDKDKADIFNNSIITWMKQIRKVLDTEPEQNLKGGNNPGPEVEIEFWQKKAENLNSIHEQLEGNDVAIILKMIRDSKSTYATEFEKQKQAIKKARDEANDNFMYLRTLSDYFKELNDPSKEFTKLHELFMPIMKVILLIWERSEYYNKPARLVVLIREICNAIINKANHFVSGPAIISMIKSKEEVSKACSDLQTTIDICTKFKECFFEFKKLSKSNGNGGWALPTNALFIRLDSFLERCHDIMHISETILQFNKLEDIQIGGTKGSNLTTTVKQIFEQFNKAVHDFHSPQSSHANKEGAEGQEGEVIDDEYDIMDISKKQFDEHFFQFRNRIKELERRLAAVITQSFDDLDTLTDKFRLLDSFDELLKRPIIQDELEKKHIVLIETYKKDLKTVQEIFVTFSRPPAPGDKEKKMDEQALYKNLPPYAGTLNWTRSLKGRINAPLEKLEQISPDIKEKEEFKDVEKMKKVIEGRLNEDESQNLLNWQKQDGENAEHKLDQFLLVRDETNMTLRVNFDPSLVSLLREVKYLKNMEGIKIPEPAEKVYSKSETYRKQVNKLDQIVEKYNFIVTKLEVVEEPLISNKIEKLNETLRPGIEELKWKSPDIDTFINSAIKNVAEVYEIVETMKNDLEKIREMLGSLNNENKMIMERKHKSVSPEDFLNEHNGYHAQQQEKIKKDSQTINRKIKDITDKIIGPGSNASSTNFKKSKEYKDYLEFINDIVIDGLCKAICTSLTGLNNLVKVGSAASRFDDYQPLFDVRLDIKEDRIQYEPSISNPSDSRSIRSIIQKIVDDYISYASLSCISRIDTGAGDYINEMHDNFEIRHMMAAINENLNLICVETDKYKSRFDKFKILWSSNPEAAFKEFRTKEPNPEQMQRAAEDQQETIDPDKNNPIMEGVVTQLNIPPLPAFDKRIEELKKLKKDVLQLETHFNIEWLKINTSPLKNSLESRVDVWINMYTNFFLTQVKTFLKNCEDFKKYLIEGTSKDPSEHPEDTALLKKVMEVLAKDKVVSQRLTPNVDYIKKLISKLKENDVEMKMDPTKASDGKGDDFFAMVEEIVTSFNEISARKVLTIKNSILPLKQKETLVLKDSINKFSAEIAQFRSEFLEKAPFDYNKYMSLQDIDGFYDKLDGYFVQLEDFKARAKHFNQLEILFELEPTKYKQIFDCQSDLKFLKRMWDTISMIRSNYDSWMKVLWKKMNIPEYSEENLKYINVVLKGLPREVKLFKGFPAITLEVENMKKTIECLGILSGGKLEKRHWAALATAIKSGPIEENSPSFCFESMVKLRIYEFVKEVTELEETAQKESTTGKILGELMKKWKERAFQFENFVLLQEELKIFKQFDEIQNELSADNLRVLGFIAQGKSVEIFKNDIDELKVRLGNIDECLVVWEKVQKNWKRLVNIFMLSDDIRNQLPEATKLFETKNNEFKGIMAEAYSNPILYDICRPEKREELEGILKAIESCEKQLNQYLEQKKKIFPRFYFVSNQTLIDILSNGNNPQKIATEYLGDLFDGLKKLILAKPKEGDLTMKAEAMWSKDDEEVKFKTPFEPTEAVEVWLNKLEYKMRETLENYLIQAKKEADGLMRNQEVEWEGRLAWVFNYCAQISLLVVQIIWTEDVHQAFDDIEGGQSGAMKECLKVIKNRISSLISKVRGKLTPGDRNKIITIITIDVHSRDAVEKLSYQGINDKENFQWSSQLKFALSADKQDIINKGQRLRFEWETNKDRENVIIKIVDWIRFYSYEYIGNCGRLVITPLTDRCYITLTQALGLCMGGAPAGPAGTGKTETTKDLGRAIGLAVFVFNCSEQMSTDSLGQNFMGLSQTGAWGCFDEFNRISIEVLSVVSTQVKSIQDALRVMLRNKDSKEDKFMFMEEEISLADTVGLFITMNPGYAGRTELPESLKALFRSCAMVVPDLVLICENMLMSEGYEEAKELAKKFVTLYVLSRSLLSKQKHYDWGLRAVKSVLRQAGKLKRDPSNAGFGEKKLLMRALRDFNMPKIYIEDKSIFINLLKDLFKGEEEPPVLIDEKLERAVAQVAEALHLIPDSTFCTKCVQLSEILEVRHCVFVIGPPGSGKSKVWSTLLETYKRNGADTEKDCLDPKAVTSDELFGVLTKSKEFKNGVLSSIIRNQSKEYGKYKVVHKHKWAVLDGDIDPEWIESLNTVMDDNKVLTLVSNDRFPITPTMRLVFEISNLRNATPATVSRAGVIYINDTDIGWKPFLDSWLHGHRAEVIEKRRDKKDNVITRKAVFDLKAESVFMKCFSQLEKSEVMKLNRICPVVEIQLVQTTCALIDELVLESFDQIQHLKDENEQKAAYEGIFYYASMWGYGGAIAIDPNDDKKSYSEFDKTWRQRAKIPEVALEGLGSTKYKPVYDFQFNISTQQWEQIAADNYETQEDTNFLRIFVPTVGTQRLTRLIQLHVLAKKPILFVGNAGTGKTTVINQYLNAQQKSDKVITYNTNFSSKTSSASLQENIMNSGIEKLGTRFFGLSNKTLVFFIDDMNMPYVDKYGTQSPIALLRQIIDYGIVYDRDNLEEYITLKDLYFCGCMNPKAGSFTIEPRLQRHFSVFAVQTPDETIIKQIYTKILAGHFERFRFTPNIDVPTKMVDATFLLFKSILEKGKNFSPTAQKFHYQFNLREISRITEGVMMGTITNFNDKLIDVFKLWVHETRRVFEDRLIFKDDITMFRQLQMNAYNLMAADTPLVKDAQKEEVFSETNIFTSFISVWEVMDEKYYLPIKTREQLTKCLNEKLAEYNESNSQMNLVLFFEAVQHICRIARIIERPAGNALLVGVGGSGKQSLTKLAVFIHSQELDVVKSTSFNIADFKTSLINMFKKVTKPPGVAKCMVATDAQLANENILIYLNEILNSGYISGIWEPKVEFDAHLNSLKNEVKNSGFTGSNYQYFVEKIRKNLHVCLCMSPVGDTLRVRARKFPGIVNQCQIDWFHSWPQQALYDVAYSFLKELPLPEKAEKMEVDIRQLLSEAMSETHIGIDETNKDFLAKERRYNYTTPKSFLELIDFYKSSFAKTNEKIEKQIISLQKSLIVLKETNEKVNNLKEVLKVISAEVEVKSRETEKLLNIVNADKADAEEEQRKADVESEKTNKVKLEAETIAAEALVKFMQAKPMQEKAENSIQNLSETMIGEMGKFAKPPVLVVLVGRALLYLLSRKKGIDLYKEAQPEKDWPDVQKMMKEPKRFLNDLRAFAGGAAKELDLKFKDYLRPLLAQPEFQVKEFAKISVAGQNLCDFIHNIINFSDAYQIVAPLEAKSKEAKARRDVAVAELNAVLAKVAEIKAKVEKLEIKLAEAQEEKRIVEEKRNYNLMKMQNAEDLVNGLSSNQIRWVQTENRLQLETMTAIGESLLAAQFVSYIGPFSASFRVRLWRDNWLPKIKDKKIPITDGIDPLRILTNSDGIARWKNEGLPEDQMSIENASIITSSNRWPLIIDPQLQGGSWITGHVATNEMFKRTTKVETADGKEEYQTANEQLLRISLNSDRWELKLEEAIQAGRVVMLENVTQEIDPILDPLLSRAFIYKKGNSNQAYIMFNREEPVYYHRDFRLYLQCKISNPHFKPETAAQCSIINFIVTESGLEDQLLAVVVDVEKPELERKKTDIMRKMNENAVKLVELDNQLLLGLAKANPDTILDDIELITTLNKTKSASKEIEIATAASKITEREINEERNNYRPVAAEGSMLYFLIISLNAVNHMYQYSLESFHTFFDKGIHATPKDLSGKERIQRMVLVIRETIYEWIARGLFEKHKILFLSMMTFRLMTKGHLKIEYTEKELRYLLSCIPKFGIDNPVKDWLKGTAWNNALRLAELNGFEKLPESMGNELASRFKEWYSQQNPENENLPPSWKFVNQNPFKRLLVLRALRPDRMIPALSNFIREALPEGQKFVGMDQNNSFSDILKSAYKNATQEGQLNTPIFFILSTGADPVREVEKLGEHEGFSTVKNNFFNISLGQGQDVIANAKLDISYKEGCWIMLQNIHLMPSWLPTFEKILDRYSKEGGASDRFRLFLSAEPSIDIPISILEKCIKLTNEPPTGLKANMKRAWTYFNPAEVSEKDPRTKGVLFALCYFHSVLIERRKFGPKGWNMFYPFNIGDLRDSARVLDTNVETGGGGGRLPWADFKYIFGEIMYGGHIVDDWDRRLCAAYLEGLMVNDLQNEEFELLPFVTDKPSLKTPPLNGDHEKFKERIETSLTDKETPIYYGLHPNAEINLGTTQCNTLFETLMMLQPQDVTAKKVEVAEGDGDPANKDNPYVTKVQSDWVLAEKMFNLEDIKDKVSDNKGPYQNVFLQECEYMNYLIEEICSSLGQLKKAKDGELTYSEKLEKLETNLNLEKVPDAWADLAYPAKRTLSTWFENLLRRIEQLSAWKDEPTTIPKVTKINLLFNPQSFLTAIKQESKRDDLNKLTISTEFTKKTLEQIDVAAKDGAYCHGFLLDGASWDTPLGLLDEAKPKEMYSHMPVCLCRSVKMPDVEREDKSVYQCPVYRTEMRGATYIFTAQLKTPPKYDPRKWVLAGVAIILDVEGESDLIKTEKEEKK